MSKPPRPPRKPGRPMIGTEARSQLMGVRAQPSQIRRWKAVAAKAGISLQQFVIDACEALAKRLGG